MSQPILELRDVWKIYAQESFEVTALQEIELAIEEGEYVVIMGPSGSGKSTLLNVLCCLDRITRGEYRLG
ncbi:ATP-binding cassette domain-containing protein, partial [bacterium]|nr:ATP-binding cassette domain-containing protein [bacterium]